MVICLCYYFVGYSNNVFSVLEQGLVNTLSSVGTQAVDKVSNQIERR